MRLPGPIPNQESVDANCSRTSIQMQETLFECLEDTSELAFDTSRCKIISRGIQSLTKSSSPTVYVVAGPNGAGKTTFASQYLPNFAHCGEFVNADLIAAGLSPFNPESQAIMAGRLMLERIENLASSKTTFGFETTLGGRTHAARLRDLKANFAYQTSMFFIWLPSVELAIARVATRVREGGHNIPRQTIIRRYHQGIRNFSSLYQPVLDEWYVYDGSNQPASAIVGQQRGKRLVFDNTKLIELNTLTPELLS